MCDIPQRIDVLHLPLCSIGFNFMPKIDMKEYIFCNKNYFALITVHRWCMSFYILSCSNQVYSMFPSFISRSAYNRANRFERKKHAFNLKIHWYFVCSLLIEKNGREKKFTADELLAFLKQGRVKFKQKPYAQ